MEDMAYCQQPQNLDRVRLSLLLGAPRDSALDLGLQIKASYTPLIFQLWDHSLQPFAQVLQDSR